jgi:NADP-dependent 3-hydroxy acid dehydrogenase YdfG
METGLKNKVVLITGAGSGIGRATALAFATEGAALALVDLDINSLGAVATEAQRRGVKTTIAAADLATEAGVNSGIDTALEPFGRADILVNNVGAHQRSSLARDV